MKTGIYVVRDVLSGEYQYFGNFVNDQVALRAFKTACQDPNVPATDLELYNTARLDSKTGRIYDVKEDVPISVNPEFVGKGEKNVSHDV